jgi:hypothetical protein
VATRKIPHDAHLLYSLRDRRLTILPMVVIPAKAGIQFFSTISAELDPGFRRDDEQK